MGVPKAVWRPQQLLEDKVRFLGLHIWHRSIRACLASVLVYLLRRSCITLATVFRAAPHYFGSVTVHSPPPHHVGCTEGTILLWCASSICMLAQDNCVKAAAVEGPVY